MALAYTVRDRMIDRYIATVDAIAGANTTPRSLRIFQREFLTGPHLGNGLINLGIWDAAEEALSRVGQDLPGLLEQEEEPGLGNGGLGRLAACYMDSLATLNVPAIGYGIRYEFGIFDQAIRDGWQVEVTDKWLRFGNPWEIVRSEITFDVKLGGRTEHYHDDAGRYRVRWIPETGGQGHRLRHPGPGLSGRRRPTCCACGRPKPPSRSTSTRSTSATTTGAVDEKVDVGNHLQGALSERRARSRQAAAAGAAVLLRVVLAAGHDPPASDARQAARRASIRTGPRS